MSKLQYTLVDQCTVMAYDPDKGKAKWKRCLRTYFRDTHKFPIISLQVFNNTITASWLGSIVILSVDTGKVQEYHRAMFMPGSTGIVTQMA